MLYVIGNKRLSLSVESFGAQPVSIKKDGKEMLWQNDNGAWSGSAPILFPYGGNVRVVVNGKEYPKAFHGLAKINEFSFVSQTAASLTLSFKSSAKTKEVFPFDFEFIAKYAVKNTTLFITYTVINPSVDKNLYFSCGGHESFNISGKLEDYYVEFEKPEKLTRMYHEKDGRLLKNADTYPVSDVMCFKDFPVATNDTLIFKGIKSSYVRLRKRGGETVCETHFKGFHNLLCWRAENSPYICVEPWKNLPDTVGEENIEFKDKYGVEKVPPQSEKTIRRKIIY